MEVYMITVFVGVMFWTILFSLTRKMFHKRPFKFSGHIVCVLHSLQFVFLASYTVRDWTAPLSPLASAASPLQMKILAANLAFYIYDLGRYRFDLKNVPKADIIHHMIVIVALILALAFQPYGSEAMAETWAGELSGPLFYFRQLLKELDYKGTNLDLAVDILYVAAFTFGRMICGSYLTYFFLTHNYPLQSKAAALALQLLHTFFFYKIVRGRMYKYFFYKQRRNSSQKIHSS